jgi:hypothetical protein
MFDFSEVREQNVYRVGEGALGVRAPSIGEVV